MNDRHFPRARPIHGTPEAGCFFIGALIGAGASIIGGIMGRETAEEASQISADAGREALDFQREAYDQAREDLAPYRAVGPPQVAALGTEIDELTRPFGESDFRADPGYQFRLDEGEKAINRAAAARGGFSNPATVKALSAHAGGLADQTYGDAFSRYQVGQGNRFNRLMALAGVGGNAVSAGLGAGSNFAGNASQIAMGTGAQRADAALTGGNALISGVTGGVANAVDMWNARNRSGIGAGSPGPTPGFGYPGVGRPI